MEEWKDVLGFDGNYQVSSFGNVRSLDKEVRTSIRHSKARKVRGRVLKPHVKSHGYYAVSLPKNGKWHATEVHRLVARAFLPNPDKKKTVNHKDGNKLNNHVENLEWASYKENHWHARDVGLLRNVGRHFRKAIKCVETGTVFNSSMEAAEWIAGHENPRSSAKNISTIAKNIRGCVTGRTPKAYGYHWTEL